MVLPAHRVFSDSNVPILLVARIDEEDQMDTDIEEYERKVGVVYEDGHRVLPGPEIFQEEALRNVATLVVPVRVGGRWHESFSIDGVTPPADMELGNVHYTGPYVFVALWGDEEQSGEEYEYQLFMGALSAWASAALGGAKLVVFPILDAYKDQLWALERGIYDQKIGHESAGFPTPDHTYVRLPLRRPL